MSTHKLRASIKQHRKEKYQSRIGYENMISKYNALKTLYGEDFEMYAKDDDLKNPLSIMEHFENDGTDTKAHVNARVEWY